MMTVETVLRPSSIEGLGVFATTFIPAGAVIWRLDQRFDVRFRAAEVPTFPMEMQKFINRYGYPHMTDPSLIVVELDHGRFMNHSLTPNTNFTDAEVGFAVADINPGDEITCNYYEFDITFDGGFGFTSETKARQPETAVP
jgi:uncharacterized protein